MSGTQFVTYGLGSQPFGNVPAVALDQNFADATNYPNSAAPIRSLANKASDIISVKDAPGGGAVGNAVADDTVAIQAVVNSLPATGGAIYFPQSSNAYLITQAINITVGGTSIYGGGRGSVFLIQNTHNADFFSVQAGNCSFRNIGFKVNAQGSQHWAINANAASDGLTLIDVSCVGLHSCLNFLGVNLRIILLNILNLNAGGGIGIQINNANATSFITHVQMGNAAGSNAFAGIYILASAVTQISNCDLYKMGTCLYLLPGAGVTVGATFCDNCFFDTSVNGLIMDATAVSAVISVSEFSECWMDGNSSYGARLRGTVRGVGFTMCQFGQNTLDGLLLETSGVQDIIVSACKCFGNGGHGINVGANVNLFKLLGNTCGPYAGVAGNTGFGIVVQAGTSNNYQISDNDVHGNTAGPISNSATGTTCIVADNMGSGQSVTGAIAVTASPFTYTAGSSPETVYINTGTVSLVTVEGVGIFQQTNCTVRLRPKQSVVVTYTVAPGMAKTVEG